MECPSCGRVYEDWRRASVNVSLDPEIAADDDYMEQASTATCPHCGHKVRLGTLVVGADDVWRWEARDELDHDEEIDLAE